MNVSFLYLSLTFILLMFCPSLAVNGRGICNQFRRELLFIYLYFFYIPLFIPYFEETRIFLTKVELAHK